MRNADVYKNIDILYSNRFVNLYTEGINKKLKGEFNRINEISTHFILDNLNVLGYYEFMMSFYIEYITSNYNVLDVNIKNVVEEDYEDVSYDVLVIKINLEDIEYDVEFVIYDMFSDIENNSFSIEDIFSQSLSNSIRNLISKRIEIETFESSTNLSSEKYYGEFLEHLNKFYLEGIQEDSIINSSGLVEMLDLDKEPFASTFMISSIISELDYILDVNYVNVDRLYLLRKTQYYNKNYNAPNEKLHYFTVNNSREYIDESYNNYLTDAADNTYNELILLILNIIIENYKKEYVSLLIYFKGKNLMINIDDYREECTHTITISHINSYEKEEDIQKAIQNFNSKGVKGHIFKSVVR